MTAPPRSVVLVGGGTAAAFTAGALRARGYDGRLTLVAEEACLPYQRPPLSKEVLAGADPVTSTEIHDASWWAAHDVDVLLGNRAVEIDAPSRTVLLDDGRLLAWDRLLLATGGIARRPPGLDGERVLTLRTRADATALAEHLHHIAVHGGRIAILGGGFIGCEVAAQARAAGIAVTVVEMAGTCLERPLGARFGQVVTDMHREAGVEVLLDHRVTGIATEPHGCLVQTAQRLVECDIVLVAVGMQPREELAVDTPIAVAQGILTDARGRTSVEGIFAAGDVARRQPHDGRGPSVRVEHHDTALRQGEIVAASMLGDDSVEQEPDWFWSDQYDVRIQSLGPFDPSAASIIRGSVEERAFSAWQLENGQVRAILSIGRPRDVLAARKLMAAGVAVAPETLADPSVDLRPVRPARPVRTP